MNQINATEENKMTNMNFRMHNIKSISVENVDHFPASKKRLKAFWTADLNIESEDGEIMTIQLFTHNLKNLEPEMVKQ